MREMQVVEKGGRVHSPIEKKEIRFAHAALPHRLRQTLANPLVARLSETRHGFSRTQSANGAG